MKTLWKLTIPIALVSCIFFFFSLYIDKALGPLQIMLLLLIAICCGIFRAKKAGKRVPKWVLFIFVLVIATAFFWLDDFLPSAAILSASIVFFAVILLLLLWKMRKNGLGLSHHMLSNIQDPSERIQKIEEAKKANQIEAAEYHNLMSIAHLDLGLCTEALTYNENFRTEHLSQNSYTDKIELVYLNNRCIPLLFLEDLAALAECADNLELLINQMNEKKILLATPKLAKVKLALAKKDTNAANRIMSEIHNIGSITPRMQLLSSIYDAILSDLTGDTEKALTILERVSLNTDWIPIRQLADELTWRLSKKLYN